MRRMMSLILAGVLLGALSLTAWAETEAPETSPPPEEETVEQRPSGEEAPEDSQTAALILDSVNVYEGMDSAYEKGYTPRVTQGTAIVVLPLTASGELKEGRLTASVELGDPTNSPFIYRTYQKDFFLSTQKTQAGEEQDIYYVRFDLALAKKRVNGVYPVTIQLSAGDSTGGTVSQSFTTYVTITDGIDPNAPEEESPPPAAETPTSSPVVLVSGYTVSPNPVEAGGSCEVTVTLQNTSSRKAVQNMVVTVESPDGNFTLLNDSDTIFLGSLGAEETTRLSLRYDVGQNTPEGQYTFSLSLSYDDPEAVSLSSSGRFSLQVRQPLEVQLTMPRVAETVYAGDTIPLDFQVLNLGRSRIYNVQCQVAGVGLFPTSSAFVGDMDPGTEGNASLNLFIGTKDMTEGYEGAAQYGAATGTVTLSYENEAGEAFTQEYTFNTVIEKPVTSVIREEQEVETAGQWWISVGILGGILAAGGIGFGGFCLGKRKR